MAKTDETTTTTPIVRDPSYDVFREGAEGVWVPLAAGVSASSRREAIVAATATRPEDERYGSFAVVRAGEFKIIGRARKVEPQDVWS